jgi:predicted transcriptional regulator
MHVAVRLRNAVKWHLLLCYETELVHQYVKRHLHAKHAGNAAADAAI